LVPIIGFTQLLGMDHSGDDAALAKVGYILKAAESATKLVQQLLSFSRKQVLEMKVLDLNQVITTFHTSFDMPSVKASTSTSVWRRDPIAFVRTGTRSSRLS
jgi:hypothetical protein